MMQCIFNHPLLFQLLVILEFSKNADLQWLDLQSNEKISLDANCIVYKEKLSSNYWNVCNFIYSCLFSAIKSLDLLNEQIVQFIFSPKATEIDFDNDLSAKDKEALQTSMALMRQLLKVIVMIVILGYL